MKFVDKTGRLPEPLKRAIEHQATAHSVGAANISVSSLKDSPLIRYLWRVYGAEIEVDYTSRLYALYGSLAHGVVERFGKADVDKHMEYEVIAQVGAWRVSGHIDLIATADGALVDYKFTSSYAIADGGKREWEEQLNMYLHLLRNSVNPADHEIAKGITRLQICAMLRDWGPRMRDKIPHQVVVLDVPIWDDAKCRAYAEERVRLHIEAESQPAMPPCCTDEERWVRAECYAVMQEGRKTALKLFKFADYDGDQAQAQREADSYAMCQKKACRVVLRKSEPKRCMEYCDVAHVCPYRQAEVAGEEGRVAENENW